MNTSISYTVEEVAGVLKCSDDHVRNLISAGRLKYKNIALGGRPKLRVSGKQLQAFLDEAA